MSGLNELVAGRIRSDIRDGYISEAARGLIRMILVDLERHHPASWDKKFCEDMLVYKRKMSKKQREHLERILDNELIEIEYPSGFPEDSLPF